MNRKQFTDALDNLLDKPIAFNPSFKKITGSTNAALLLSQAFYWTKRATLPDGWFWKTRDEWMEETGLTEAELDGAREKCRTTGVLEEKLKGVPATLHYRVNRKKVYELLGFQFPENTETEIPGKSESGLPENSQIPGKQESGTNGDFNNESESSSLTTSTNGAALAEITKVYESEIGMITPFIADSLQDAAETYPLKWTLDAIHEAAAQNKRSWKYIEAILKRWKAQGNQDQLRKPANGNGQGMGPAPAIDERTVKATLKELEDKWNFTPAPPPDRRPRIGKAAS